jgi:hypothetical protein
VGANLKDKKMIREIDERKRREFEKSKGKGKELDFFNIKLILLITSKYNQCRQCLQ